MGSRLERLPIGIFPGMSAAAARGFRPLLFVLLVICGVLLGACGGDADGNGGDRALTKREYIERFNVLQQDAATIFDGIDDATRDAASAKSHLADLDELIAGVNALRPPKVWQDEHRTMLSSLRVMRQSIDVLSRAPASQPGAINAQVQRFADAQRDFRDAVRDVNATR